MKNYRCLSAANRTSVRSLPVLVRGQNLTEWKQGGYRDWVAQQAALHLAKRIGSDVAQAQAATSTDSPRAQHGRRHPRPQPLHSN